MSSTSPTHDLLTQHSVVIWGLGREGWSSYRFVRQAFPEKLIWVADDKNVEELKNRWREELARDAHLQFLDVRRAPTPTQFSTPGEEPPLPLLIIKTPGIPLTHPWLTQLNSLATAPLITSNTQLLFDLVAALRAAPTTRRPVITIGVTGTKGKSTTTSLIHHVLKHAGKTTLLGGNIGVPPLDLWPTLQQAARESSSDPLFVTLELSCHQLATLTASPSVAVVQNIVPEHLDYYATFEEYWTAKSQITRFQTSQDIVIYNPAYTAAADMAALSAGKHLTFLTTPRSDSSTIASSVAQARDNTLWYQAERIITTSELPLLGAHNWENTFPAIIIGKHVGLSTPAIHDALTSFRPLPHRLEKVAEIAGVTYINDSLSTAPEAAVAALAACAPAPTILIAGGYDRHLDFTVLAEAILDHAVHGVVLFRPTGEQIAASLTAVADRRGAQLPPLSFAETMTDAVTQASALAKPGSIVLMSPASASFGQFVDYQDRGNQFREVVEKLKYK